MDIEKTIADRQRVRVSRDVDRYQKRYKGYIKDLDKSPLARVRSITEEDHWNLGKQFEQFEDYVGMHEADGSVTSLGTLPRVALDAIAINYGASPINAIASVQPIDEVQGLVYFRQFVAQNTRGNVTAGQTLMDSLAVPQAFQNGFAGDLVTGAEFINDSSGLQTYVNVKVGGNQDFQTPLNNQNMSLYGTAVFSAGTATFPTMGVDPASGKFSSAVLVGASLISVYGTVNFATGQVSLQFSTAPSGSVAMFANYEVVLEAGVDLTKAILVLQSKPVNAEFYALKSTIGLAESYMLRKRFGINAEEEIARDLAVAINNEIMFQAVATLTANIPGSATVTWDRQPQSGVDYFSHKMTILDAMADSSAKIIKNAGRGSANIWIVGRQAAAILSTLPGFQLLFNDDSFGPHIYGTLNGQTIVRVPYQSVLDDFTMIGIHKGKQAFDAPLAWSPYMPIVTTNTLPMAYNPLAMQRACAIWGALTSLVPNLSTQLVIGQSGSFTYGGVS